MVTGNYVFDSALTREQILASFDLLFSQQMRNRFQQVPIEATKIKDHTMAMRIQEICNVLSLIHCFED